MPMSGKWIAETPGWYFTMWKVGNPKTVEISSAYPALRFSDDGKKIYLQDKKEGLKIYSVEDLSLLDTIPEITDSSLNILVSEDDKIFLVNRFSGTASLYDLESKQHLEDIPGEVLNLKHQEEEIILKGIQNNTAFTWSSKTGLKSLDMDEALTQTPVSFDDVNLYNEKENLLLLIRNNDTERKAYVVDFANGTPDDELHPFCKVAILSMGISRRREM